jgi:hypothetical protein
MAFSMVFMGVFIYFGLTFMTNLRFRYRPEEGDVEQLDPTKQPRAGGWANPTSGQRFTQRLTQIWKSSRRR